MTVELGKAARTRQGLLSRLDEYFECLGGGDPSRLELSDALAFTEDGQRVRVGEGLWATVTGASATRAIRIADTRTSSVAGWGLVEEAGAEMILGARLSIDPRGAISEIEHVTVRRAPFGTGVFSNSLRTTTLFEELDLGVAPSREELTNAAHGYLDGVSTNQPRLIPVAEECLRFENGAQTVLNPEAIDIPEPWASGSLLGLNIVEQIASGDFSYIEAIRDRRPIVIDEKVGVVLMACFFDHPGQLRGAAYRSPIAAPNSMMIWELFQVRGGRIRHIEAIGSALPYGTRSGW